MLLIPVPEQDETLEEAKRISRVEYEQLMHGVAPLPAAGMSVNNDDSRQDWETNLRDDLSRIEKEISDTQYKLHALQAEKDCVLKKLQEQRRRIAAAEEEVRERGQPIINYMDDFDWTPALRATMKRIFDINDFRLCQKGSV